METYNPLNELAGISKTLAENGHCLTSLKIDAAIKRLVPQDKEMLEAIAEDGLLVAWDKDYRFSFSQVVRLMAEFALEHPAAQPSPDAAKVEEIITKILVLLTRSDVFDLSEQLRAILRPYFPESAPTQSTTQSLCGEFVAYLIAGASWFTCALPKNHKEKEHRAAGNCLAHGPYLGEPNIPPQCPQWPKCATDPRIYKPEFKSLKVKS